MGKTNLSKLFIVGVVALALIVVLIVAREAGMSDMTNSTTPLSKIYGSSQIEEEGDHYLVDSKEVYLRTIELGNDNLLLIVEKQDGGARYRFFELGDNPVLLKEVESYRPVATSEEIFENNFFAKDITGDGIDELFIKVEQSASNLRVYEILKKEGNSLVNLTRERDASRQVSFDEIAHENGYITMTWHATDAVGKSLYEIEDNVFVLVKSVGFFQVPIYGENCEVRVRDANEDFRVMAKEKCDALGRDFSPYLTN